MRHARCAPFFVMSRNLRDCDARSPSRLTLRLSLSGSALSPPLRDAKEDARGGTAGVSRNQPRCLTLSLLRLLYTLQYAVSSICYVLTVLMACRVWHTLITIHTYIGLRLGMIWYDRQGVNALAQDDHGHDLPSVPAAGNSPQKRHASRLAA